MKLSARNALPGTIVAVDKGPISTLVRIEIAPGIVVSAVITTDAAADMGLAIGTKAYAVIKASSVLIGVD
jgi:molybdopterin-binding protein